VIEHAAGRKERDDETFCRPRLCRCRRTGVVIDRSWAAETQTTHWKDVPFTTPDSDRSGAPVTLSGFSSGVQHITFLDSGGIHATFTEVVTFTAVRGTETFTGGGPRGGFNLNAQSITSTSTFNATGTSNLGTKLRLQVTEHFSVSATGIVREFSKFTCVD
jgi:hypothetical protein